jgi:hypothetical protein
MRTSTDRILILTILLGVTCSGVDKNVGCGTQPLYSRYGLHGRELKSPDGKSLLTVRTLRDSKDPDGYVFL